MAAPEELTQLVFLVRGEKVMFDAVLAMLYGVKERNLNQAVKRNRKRFPHDFMFQLTQNEYDEMRSQFVTTWRYAQSQLIRNCDLIPRQTHFEITVCDLKRK